MVKFDMFNGKRDDMRLVEKQLNKWYDDLIWCPSQCYYYFMHDDDMYCINLRWRHQKWRADYSGDLIHGEIWHEVDAFEGETRTDEEIIKAWSRY